MLWRAVTVSFARLCRNLRWMDPSSSSTTRGYAKSGCVSRSGPRSSATTRRPASVSSFAMMAPVHPIPTMTASTRGFTIAMESASFPGQIDGRQRIRSIAYFHPVGIVGAGTGEPDHLPRQHVLVAAILRIAKISHARFREQLIEELLGGDLLERELPCFGRLQQRILLNRFQFGERLAAVVPPAMRIHRPDSGAQDVLHRKPPLITELRRRLDEGC